VQALEAMRADITGAQFEVAIKLLTSARRVVVFGIGPSSALANYFAIQLGRFGIESLAFSQTGLLLADELSRLKKDDLVIALAYSRVYREIEALLARAGDVGASKVLLTDTLGNVLGKDVDLVLPVARGKADWFSTHTATLGLIEALLVGIAAKRPTETVASLKTLNMLRSELGSENMELPISNPSHDAPRRKRR
jgi:DNA-binding MurR/RpiR family transcriptional regulator